MKQGGADWPSNTIMVFAESDTAQLLKNYCELHHIHYDWAQPEDTSDWDWCTCTAYVTAEHHTLLQLHLPCNDEWYTADFEQELYEQEAIELEYTLENPESASLTRTEKLRDFLTGWDKSAKHLRFSTANFFAPGDLAISNLDLAP